MKKPSALAAVTLALLLPLCGLAADKPAAAKEAAKPDKAAPCISVASRIKRDKGQDCATSAAPTRSYTQEEIQQTGETNMAEALRKLDTRFR